MVLPEELDQLAKEAETYYAEHGELSEEMVDKLKLRGYQAIAKIDPTRMHSVVQGLRGQAETLRRRGGPVVREKPRMFEVRGNAAPVEKT